MKKRRSLSRIFFFCIKGILFILISIYALLNVYGYRLDVSDTTFVRTGVIEVRTVPRDVLVFLDGKEQSEGTPFEVHDVGLGSHQISIFKEGFNPVQRDIQVEGTFIVRIGKIFLLPERITPYMHRLGFGAEQEFETEHYILFLSGRDNRVIIYEKDSGIFSSGDIPLLLTDMPIEIEELGRGSFLFLVNGSIYLFSSPQMTLDALPLIGVDEVHTDRNRPEQFFYRIGNTLYTYNIMTHKNFRFLSHISSFHTTYTTLFFCDDQQFSLHAQSLLPTSSNENISLMEALGILCPIDDVQEYMGKYFLLSDSALGTFHRIIDRNVSTRPLFLQAGTILYTVGGALYYTGSKGENRTLISRFSQPIDAITQGPSNSHVFIATKGLLSFCDINNTFCSPLVSFSKPVHFLYYHQKPHALLIRSGTEIYQIQLPFWEQPWFS